MRGEGEGNYDVISETSELVVENPSRPLASRPSPSPGAAASSNLGVTTRHVRPRVRARASAGDASSVPARAVDAMRPANAFRAARRPQTASATGK